MASLLKSNATNDPIYSLLNAPDEKERDELTKRWKDNKLQELSFVGIVVSTNPANDHPGAPMLKANKGWPSGQCTYLNKLMARCFTKRQEDTMDGAGLLVLRTHLRPGFSSHCSDSIYPSPSHVLPSRCQ
jgi:hypothetical protein